MPINNVADPIMKPEKPLNNNSKLSGAKAGTTNETAIIATPVKAMPLPLTELSLLMLFINMVSLLIIIEESPIDTILPFIFY